MAKNDKNRRIFSEAFNWLLKSDLSVKDKVFVTYLILELMYNFIQDEERDEMDEIFLKAVQENLKARTQNR